MSVGTNREALDKGRSLGAIHLFATLGLVALCCSGASAASSGAGQRAFARHDYSRAASLLLVEAEQGSPFAQTYLGYLYQSGLGVPRA